MNIKCRETRKNRRIKVIQNKLDLAKRHEHILRCPHCRCRTDGITKVSVNWLEDKVNDFILFLEKDKSRLKNLDRAKFDFLNKLVNKSINH